MMLRLSRLCGIVLVTAILFISPLGNVFVHADSNDSKPTSVGWASIAVGTGHSLGIKEDGTVWAWGVNSWGQIGNGERGGSVDSAKVLSPVQVKGLHDVVAVAAGGSHSLALKKDGTVWAWGSNLDGVLGNAKETTMRSTSKHPAGEVIENNDQLEPAQVEGISDVIAIAADFAASYALKKDGTIWGWGFVSNPYSLVPVQLPGWENIKAITSGYGGHLQALQSDGTVVESDGKGHIVRINGISKMTAIASGAQYTYGLKEDGTVWYWGANGQGLFNGQSASDKSAPKVLEGIKDVIAVQASSGGPLLLKKDGTVWTSGSNYGGQLGIGSYEDSAVPVQVKGLIRVKKIAASGIGLRSMAIKSDGSLWAWGNGYVGDGTKWWRTEPVWIKSNDLEELQEDPIWVEIDGKVLDFDQPPVLMNDHTLVPLRKIFESMGADIQWDQDTSTVTATKGTTVIKLTIGSDIAYVNDQKFTLDAPPEVVNDRSLVPTRFIGESFGAKVTWEDASKTVKIKTK